MDILKKKKYKRRYWFILLCIYWIINFLLKQLASNFIHISIILQMFTSILGIIVFLFPYWYILEHLRKVETNSLKQFLRTIVGLFIYYSLYFLYLRPYPGDYVILISIIFKISSLRMIFIVLILILPAFFININKSGKLNIKDISHCSLFIIVLQFLIMQLIVLIIITYINTKALVEKWSIAKYNLNVNNSFIINIHYFIPLLFLSIIITLVVSILCIEKENKKILYDVNILYSLVKTILNSMCTVFAILLKNKVYIVLFIMYIIILTIIQWKKKFFTQWLKEYTNDILNNTFEVLFIGTFYSVFVPGQVTDYLKGDFLQSLMAILILYMTLWIMKYSIDKTKEDIK